MKQLTFRGFDKEVERDQVGRGTQGGGEHGDPDQGGIHPATSGEVLLESGPSPAVVVAQGKGPPGIEGDDPPSDTAKSAYGVIREVLRERCRKVRTRKPCNVIVASYRDGTEERTRSGNGICGSGGRLAIVRWVYCLRHRYAGTAPSQSLA